MAFRSDIRIEWFLSPRIIRVAAPSTEVGIQDLHDTLRQLEQDPNVMQYPFILSTTGKQVLGPGVFVGLTSELQNARIAFDARKVSKTSGTVTTPDVPGTNLFDSAASFVTIDEIQPGAWIVNFTDQSICSAVNVIDDNRIFTDGLGDGYDNQFELGDVYKIWPVIQVEVLGGNIVAVDGYAGDPIDAILPTAGTQAVRTGSSSATLTELADIQFSSFNGGVTVDTTSSFSGVIHPVGTPRQPVNNFIDALSILQTNNFDSIFIIGNAILSDLDFTGLSIHGQDVLNSAIIVNASANVTNVNFFDCTLGGALDTNAGAVKCIIGTVTSVSGQFDQCELDGYITLAGDTFLTNCVHSRTNENIDVDVGTGSTFVVRNYFGDMKLVNKTGSDPVILDMSSGTIEVDGTVTNGTITVRGVGQVTDNSAGATVVTDDLVNPDNIASTTRSLILPPILGSV